MKYFKFVLLLLLVHGCHSSAFAATEPTDYELIAASQSVQVLGPGTATTKQGDYLDHLIIVPETTGAGTVAIKDGSDTAINVLVTGTLSNLAPIIVDVKAKSMTGSWQVTTGSNVHVIAVGRFK